MTPESDASPESQAAPVGTSGEEAPPSPTDAAPAPPLAAPPPPADGRTAADTPRQEPRQPRDFFARNFFIAIGLVAAVVLVVFGLFTEHHRHE